MEDEKSKLKEALTFETQLKHLMIDKKLKVGNKSNALKVLKKENYYRLSGYWINFVDNNDIFYQYITFEQIYSIYKFDKVLRGMIIEIINDVEVYFKTRLANYFSLAYGADGYMDDSNFKEIAKNKHRNLLKKIEDLKNNNPNNLIIKHHKTKYGGDMPLWVVIELLSFGNVSKLFSMMTNEDKKNMVKQSYKNISYTYIESFYHAIAYFRNQCCHFHRLYDVKHTIKMLLYKTPFYDPDKDNSSTFYFIYVIILLNPNHDLGKRLIFRLLSEFKKTKVDKKKYGFPYNWKEILEKANGYCIDIH
ncbi:MULTISPECIES: Abi family protein [Bacillota]|uniref:Abi family protein n=2 Tax=Amedibacillus TaxID=2749846 RepID=A0A7G9GP79_9FIRM|nr:MULTISPECIES: Abi family protein [Bacillota]MCH4284074.1 Abi family protein [Amedibacillus hominis]QNM12611.1 Abi family protein [[Eubacterium] hominis]